MHKLMRLLVALALAIGVLEAAGVAAEASPPCRPAPMCCPTNPRCWTKTFTADVTLNGFGVGSSTGSARLCVTGPDQVNAAVCSSLTGSAGANVTASFTLDEDSNTCPATGTANGTFSGYTHGNFTWTRVGAIAVLGGDVTGVAAFVVTAPLGNPCGTPIGSTVKATAVGAITG